VTPYQRFRALPVSVQLAGAAAVVMIIGALAPWIDFNGSAGFNSASNYESGVAFNAGELTIVIAVLVLFLLTRVNSRGKERGAIASLGLLGGALPAITAIRYHGAAYSVDWGLYLSAGAALALLLAGLWMLGFRILPPPN
jgi:hypothetical protein